MQSKMSFTLSLLQIQTDILPIISKITSSCDIMNIKINNIYYQISLLEFNISRSVLQIKRVP